MHTKQNTILHPKSRDGSDFGDGETKLGPLNFPKIVLRQQFKQRAPTRDFWEDRRRNGAKAPLHRPFYMLSWMQILGVRTLVSLERTSVHDVPDTELTRLLARRGTVRNFKPDPVPESWLKAIVKFGMRAPTSSNRQEYSVIQVHDPDKRRQLARIATDQQHIVTCPAFFAICADQNRVAHGMSLHGQQYSAWNLEGGLVASIDAALMGLTMSYVAESFGLSSVMIGALRNNAVDVARVLGLPPRCYAVFGLCVGWANAPPLPKPRHDVSAVLHHDRYDAASHEQAIRQYDVELAAYYRRRGVETPDAAWSEVMSAKYGTPKRNNLKQELDQLGFPLK